MIEKMDVYFASPQDLKLFQSVVDQSPRLKEVHFNACTCEFKEGYDDIRPGFLKLQQQLLRTCHQSLQTICFTEIEECGVAELSHPALINVSKLSMSTYADTFKKYWSSIISIDYDRRMPKLKEVKLETRLPPRSSDAWYTEQSDPEWSIKGRVNGSSSSVKKLSLEFDMAALKINLLKPVFPNVTIMQ